MATAETRLQSARGCTSRPCSTPVTIDLDGVALGKDTQRTAARMLGVGSAGSAGQNAYDRIFSAIWPGIAWMRQAF